MESVEPAATPSGPSAARLLRRRVRETFRVYPSALVGDVEAVHALRVAARRLRVALVLLTERPDGRRARRADRTLRDLSRAAGRGRDLDVGLEIFDASLSTADEGNARLRRALKASRARARVLAREARLDLDVARLRRDLRALAASTPIEGAALSERLLTLRRRDEEIVGRRPETLHRVRRAARRLRYAAELADLLDGTDSGAVEPWRRLQTRLGAIQDRQVLCGWLATRARRATTQGDELLALAARRALARLKRDTGRRVRELAQDDSDRPPTSPADRRS